MCSQQHHRQSISQGSLLDFTVVSPRMGPDGWPFGSVDAFPEATADPNEGAQHMKDLYLKVDPEYSGK